jgi:hypothetical protein
MIQRKTSRPKRKVRKIMRTKRKIQVFCLAIFFAIALVQGPSQASAQPSQTSPTAKRLYIEERIKTTTGGSVHCDTYGNCFGHSGTNSRNVSLEVTKEVMKKCPTTLIVTDNRELADYDLRISPGSSTLYRQNGDVAYVSPTKFKVSNLAKDVCTYVEAHP